MTGLHPLEALARRLAVARDQALIDDPSTPGSELWKRRVERDETMRDAARALNQIAQKAAASPASPPRELVERLQRYDLEKLPGSVTLLPVPRPNGEWVKFADAIASLSERVTVKTYEQGIEDAAEKADATLRQLARDVLSNNVAENEKSAAFHMHSALQTAANHVAAAIRALASVQP